MQMSAAFYVYRQKSVSNYRENRLFFRKWLFGVTSERRKPRSLSKEEQEPEPP